MKANLTLGNINPNFLAGANKVSSYAYTIARCEQATKALKAFVKEGKDTANLRSDISDTLNIDVSDIDDMLKAIASLKKDTHKKAKDKSLAIVSYYIDPTFTLEQGDIYHSFEAEAFLRNIGIISEGTLKNNKVKLVQGFANMVVDRVKKGYADRFNGMDTVTISDDKTLKNNPFILLLSILEGMYNAGLIDREADTSEAGRDSAYRYISKVMQAEAEATEA